MIWSKWNSADKVLLLAATAFFFSLCLRLQYPQSIFAEGFQFCAEAALVGGIADWFAVTALFRKPLGFSYHTAILPRRRDAFIKASVTMVQQEFFSRRKVIHHIERLHLLPMVMEWLHEPETQNHLQHRLVHFLRDFLLKQDQQAQSEMLSERLRHSLQEIPAKDILAHCGQWVKESGWDKELLGYLSRSLQERAASPETRLAIERLLEAYEKERAQGTFALLMAGLAEALDLVNLEEAAALMQQQMTAMLQELGEKDSHLQQEILALFYEKAVLLGEQEEFCRMAQNLKAELLQEIPLQEAVDHTIGYLREQFTPGESGHSDTKELPALRSRLRDILAVEYQRCLEMVESNDRLRHSIEHFLYDLVARSALHAQNLIGVIVETVLKRLTDEQLNHLVYDKVEPDLLWIRMNGSIVGSGIGLVLFLMLLAVR